MRFAGAAVDSRIIQRGELFVALKGERTDGHRFISAAVQAGAAAVLCAHPDPYAQSRGVPQLVVRDPLEVLQQLAHRHLLHQPYTRVVGIAGSNGKTSVKEATAVLLAHMAPTLRPVGSFNTEVGVPLTLLRLSPDHRFAVLEMGAQRVGEIALLCRIAPPHVGVVTVVGPEHLEFFGSMANVIRAEGEVVAALGEDGIAILNDDDREVRKMARRTKGRVVTYGRRPGVDVRARHIAGDPLTGLRFTLSYGGEKARVHLSIPGEHAVSVALAAAAVALSFDMNVQTVAAGLGELRPAKRRGEIKQGINGSTLVDDSYNANRQSALAALALLRDAQRPRGGRRWFIFGDMLELGRFSKQEHAAVGAAAPAIDELVLVGAEVRAAADAALAAGMPAERVHLFAAPLERPEELAQARLAAAAYVRDNVRPGDLVLVKGSLGVGMDAIVTELQERGKAGRARADIGARLQILGQMGQMSRQPSNGSARASSRP
jgi:UDP-N-acetylmuramoyl-tripeptide--D-alanyl-D-alanine ligase